MSSYRSQGSDPKAIADKLLAATAEGDIITAIARATWYNANSGAECPDDRVPSIADLADWLDEGATMPEDSKAVEDSKKSLGALFDDGKVSWSVDSGHLWAAALPKTQRTSSPASAVISSLEQVHIMWTRLSEKERPVHPLGPIVSAWQKRVSPMSRDSRRTGRILPGQLAMVDSGHPKAGYLWASAAHSPDGQQVLPGFGPTAPSQTPALPLSLFDLGAGRGISPGGHGAPLPLRIFIESILAVPVANRRGVVELKMTMRELGERLYPAKRSPRPSELRPRLMDAADILGSQHARIPWYNPEMKKGGFWQVVQVINVPANMDDDLIIRVELPPGAGVGPQVSDNLGLWGLRSAPAYRALLNLAYQWFNPGQTHIPVGRGNRRHWVQVNDPERYPVLNNKDLIDLCYPTTTRKDPSKQFSDAMQAIARLENAGELKIVPVGSNGRERRILPPSERVVRGE